MQGRLLPKYEGRYQAHPAGYWQNEFALAGELGLDLIEFILDFNEVEKNPLMRRAGVEEIQALSEKTGVGVKTVCADYFMEAPLHSSSDLIVEQSKNVLHKLITHCAQITVTDIVIPCVDQSSIVDEASRLRFISNLRNGIELAEKLNINLALETDLAPGPFANLLEELGSQHVTVNYDTGNSAALGFNPIEELQTYGNRITDIHIKDRIAGGGSVMLGKGDTDFHAFFKALSNIDYQGPFIMQAYRDDEGITVFKEQLEWVRSRFCI
ncbi:MAG: TIM barrel protein [Candidatus Scalindua sp.]|nr:TIM barrel protein [Candidatus Scalindua sp.]MBT6225480.1 TIM barrel protein [Candidatus Scalindua sp.]